MSVPTQWLPGSESFSPPQNVESADKLWQKQGGEKVEGVLPEVQPWRCGLPAPGQPGGSRGPRAGRAGAWNAGAGACAATVGASDRSPPCHRGVHLLRASQETGAETPAATLGEPQVPVFRWNERTACGSQ